MKKSKISESQIIAAIKEHEAGKTVGDICRGLGVHQVILHNLSSLSINCDMIKSDQMQSYKKIVSTIVSCKNQLSCLKRPLNPKRDAPLTN